MYSIEIDAFLLVEGSYLMMPQSRTDGRGAFVPEIGLFTAIET
jgi:hypothetical protein